MKLRNGTYVNRVLDINPKATLAIAQHNASLPLLRLPLEIKNHIYKYAFGGNLIHIIQYHDKNAPIRFKNTICHAPISEEDAQENFDNDKVHEWYVPANEGRHNCCRFPQEGSTSRNGEERPQGLSLSALRCCRQIYNEAHYIPYSTNTFSCVRLETLQSFVRSLAPNNRLAVRSLFLEIEYGYRNYKNTLQTAFATCIMNLKTLQHLSISISINLLVYDHEMVPQQCTLEERLLKDRVISTILTLKKLPLKTVTIIVSDDETYTHISENRWTLDEKKEWSRCIRDVLLRSNH